MLRASGKEKESKNDTDALEVMPYELLKMPQTIAELVVSYAVDTPWVLNKSIFFTNVDCTLQQILLLVKCAGPLEEFQFLVEKLIEKEIKANQDKKVEKPNEPEYYSLIDRNFTFDFDHRQGPFVQCVMIGLDQTTRKEDGTEIDKGMVECFVNIIAEKLPHRLSDVLKQAQQAAILSPEKYLELLEKIVLEQQKQQAGWEEEIKAETDRESRNLAALKALSNAFTEENEEKNKQAIETFRTFIDGQQGPLMNALGLYYANLIHLIKGVSELNIDKKREGALPESHWPRFCFETINVLRESLNRGVIKQFVNAFTQLDEAIIQQAIESLDQFDQKTHAYSTNEYGYLINNLLYLNRIHLISELFGELYQRRNELPGGYYGKNADDCCIKGAGMFQRRLPAHIRNTLSSDGGLYGVLENNKKIQRRTQVAGENYLGVVGSDCQLGVNYFYDIFGPGGPARRATGSGRTWFQNLLRAITTASKLYATNPACTMQAPPQLFVNVETRSSAIAMHRGS